MINALIGALLCAIVAAVLVFVTRGSSLRASVPLMFIAVIILVALRFGMLASVLGSLLATLLFSYFLFTPVGSFRVQKGQARTNLIWMLLIGVPVGYFAWAIKLDARAQAKSANDEPLAPASHANALRPPHENV
jgi:K+-sensing histidine kinase KdpD